MPNFVVLGCLEVGEKFTVGWVGGLFLHILSKQKITSGSFKPEELRNTWVLTHFLSKNSEKFI